VVTLQGYVPEEDMPALMRSHHALAAPSTVQRDGDMDGIPNVILEAMAVGLPVITTGVAGIPEVAVDGETALVVPERDAPALAEGLERLAADERLRASLAEGARALIDQRFDLRTSALRLMELLGIRSPD
jgi:glycosyltransferase involved in cell wall biosynthesis